MDTIKETFGEMGYAVLFVSETATELINGGITPRTCKSSYEFQKFLTELQIKKEEIYKKAAYSLSQDKVLIVLDRGLLDNKAYMSDLEFQTLVKSLNTSEVELRDHYDAVFHLVSAAKGAEKFYTTSNNNARTETIEQARELDDLLIHGWTGHPHLRVIDNSTDFKGKMDKLIKEITSFLGEPEPYEIEHKFLIEYQNIKWLGNNKNGKKIEIIQTYLNDQNYKEHRIRQRGDGQNHIYFETIKEEIDHCKRIEIEKRITEKEYLSLLMNADINKRQIRKTRYCLTYENQYFEIDVYPFWNNQAILEIELKDENDLISFPKEIKIIKEVSDDPQYKNAMIANIK